MVKMKASGNQTGFSVGSNADEQYNIGKDGMISVRESHVEAAKVHGFQVIGDDGDAVAEKTDAEKQQDKIDTKKSR